MVKMSIVFVAVLCIQVTLVLTNDYESLFASVEENDTAIFDEIVVATTVRTTRATTAKTKKATTPTRPQAKLITRTTTARPNDYSGSEEDSSDVDVIAVTSRPSPTSSRSPPTTPVEEPRAIWENGQACETNKKCVSTYLCNKNGSVVADGAFLIDERLDLGSEVAKPECPSLQMCCEKYNSFGRKQKPCNSFSAPSQCGIRNPKGLGGTAKSKQGTVDYAQYAEFPWVVAVMNETGFYGGGSLIHPKVVITAAHIIAGVDNKILKVRAGEYDTQSTEEICPHEERKVKNVLVHEQFVRKSLRNNLALLVLTEEFTMTAMINTICLPQADQIFENAVCVSSGWGKSNFEVMDRYQAFLKKVIVPVVPNDRCQELLRQTRLGVDFVLHDNFLCAGGEEGIDVCTGDGGAPLMCPSSSNKDVYVLAAVVSGGIGCGKKDVPGFYTDVAKNRDWIYAKLRILKIEIADVEPRTN